MTSKICLSLVLLILNIIFSNLYAWVNVDFIGKNYPDEKTLSRELKSKYSLIENKLISSSENEIKFQFISTHDIPADQRELTYQGPVNNSIFHEKNIKYINYGVPALFGLYGILFWDWGRVSGFRMRDEGWFSSKTYAGGADKMAHMYSHFLINRLSYDLYRSNGLSHQSALKHSFILATTVGLLIEVGDGISHYGFAVNDLISDMAGVGLGYLLNSHPYLDELIGFQIYWWNNTSSPEHKGKKFNDPIDDYNSQKYILNLRFAAIPLLRTNPITKYVNFDIGMYTRGSTRFNDDGTQGIDRTIFYGASLNITQLLQDLFPKNDYTYYASRLTKYYQPRGTGFAVDKWTDDD